MGSPLASVTRPCTFVSREMPARRSTSEFTFTMCPLWCITTTGRVADTRSRSAATMRRPSKKMGSKPQPIAAFSGMEIRASAARNRSTTSSMLLSPLWTTPSGAVRSKKPR